VQWRTSDQRLYDPRTVTAGVPTHQDGQIYLSVTGRHWLSLVVSLSMSMRF